MAAQSFKIVGVILLDIITLISNAQNPLPKYDSSYYERYRNKLIIAPIIVKRVSAIGLNATATGDRLNYYINAPAGVGLRLGYDWLAFDATIGVGTLDRSFKNEKGETKSMDFRATFIPRSFVLDIYFQKHEGLYLTPEQNALPNKFYTRPDIKTQLIGSTFLYAFNGNRFSARPSVKLDTWQKRSAGSFFMGAEVFYGNAKGDSSLVPGAYADSFSNATVTKAYYFLIGPGLGYGHTFVYKRHLFPTLMGGLNGDVISVREWDANRAASSKWNFSPNLNFRSGIGYNSENFEIGLFYFTNRLHLTSSYEDSKYAAFNNVYKFSVTKRFKPGKTIPKVVGWAGNIIEKVGLGFLIH